MTLSSRNGLLRHDGPAYRASRAGARGVQKTVLQGSLELIPEEGSPPVSTSSNPLNSGQISRPEPRTRAARMACKTLGSRPDSIRTRRFVESLLVLFASAFAVDIFQPTLSGGVPEIARAAIP